MEDVSGVSKKMDNVSIGKTDSNINEDFEKKKENIDDNSNDSNDSNDESNMKLHFNAPIVIVNPDGKGGMKNICWCHFSSILGQDYKEKTVKGITICYSDIISKKSVINRLGEKILSEKCYGSMVFYKKDGEIKIEDVQRL